MRKKVNKILAATLAAALMMTAVPVSATEWGADGSKGERDVSYEIVEPTLEVELPGDVAVTLNKMSIADTDTGITAQSGQIIGEDYNIINRSNVPVKIQVGAYIANANAVIPSATVGSATKGWPLTSGAEYIQELRASGTQKPMKIAAILADKTSALADKNQDGVFEFAYTGLPYILGREAYTYASADATRAGGALKSVDNDKKLGSGTKGTGIIDLDKTPITDLTSGAVDGKRFLLELGAYKATNSQGAEQGDENNPQAVTSFTLTGVVDPHVVYEETDLAVKFVFRMDTLSPAEAKYNASDKILSSGANAGSGTADCFGQNAIEWKGSDHGITN